MQALKPWLLQACLQHPAAAFLRIAAPDGADLLPGVHVGPQPCTLLLRGQQLLARLEVDAATATASADALAAHAAQEGQRLLAVLAAMLPRQHAPQAAPAAACVCHQEHAGGLYAEVGMPATFAVSY